MGGDAQQQPHAAAVQQAGLQVLATLSEHSDSVRAHLCQTNAIDHALALMSHADLVTQKLCACLLRVLCCEPDARETIKVYDGVRTLVSALCTRNVRLQWHVAWALAQLAEDADTAAEMGQLGAVALVLAELADECAWEGTGPVDDRLAMCTGLCAILAHLGQIDSLATLIVQTNGIHVLAKLLMLHCRVDHLNNNTNYTLLQCSALRALRVLFSLERNRQYFKRLFPHEFFCQFIDVGHYIQEMAAYEQLLVHFRLSLETSELEMQRGLESVNLRRQPLGAIGQYLLLEQLGAGAFGCVYRVKKERTEGHYALKEIFMQANSVNGDMINEIKIIRTRMRHPNVVRYRKVFVENDKLYILMDLIDGASLKDHVNSVKEKGLRFSEERIWNIIIQIVLAIKYLHKEKRIVHRDLKPNNIMLADNDKVVITDFGLAKERGDSYLKSNAGTIMYSCPEIVQDQPYGEKADIWSFGCCVYEMCALSPPFNSTNMLQLASAIVEAKYEALDTLQQSPQEADQDASNVINTDATSSPGVYTAELTDMIYACLTADAAARPDIIGVAGLMTGQLVVCIDEIIRAQYAQMQQVNRAGRQRVSQASNDSASAPSSCVLSTSAGTLASSSQSEAQISPHGRIGGSVTQRAGAVAGAVVPAEQHANGAVTYRCQSQSL